MSVNKWWITIYSRRINVFEFQFPRRYVSFSFSLFLTSAMNNNCFHNYSSRKQKTHLHFDIKMRRSTTPVWVNCSSLNAGGSVINISQQREEFNIFSVLFFKLTNKFQTLTRHDYLFIKIVAVILLCLINIHKKKKHYACT